MSSRLLPEEFVMRRDIRDDGRTTVHWRTTAHGPAIEPASLWKRRWRLAIVLLAAILGLCVLLASVLRAYGESHYDYLTGVPTLSPPAGLS